jgi:DHA1 family tetracycline resistance protein-like MFS transporter
MVAGVFSNAHIYSGFGMQTPLYVAACLSILNALLLLVFFHPVYKPVINARIEWIGGLHVFVEAFKEKKLRTLSMVFFLLQLGWATYFQFSGLYFVHRYQFSMFEVSLFMACLGVGFTIAFCYLLNILNNRFSLKMIANSSMGVMAFTLFLILIINNPIVAWVISIPSAMCLALSYSVLTAMFSNLVGSTQQGKIMGLTSAIGAFSFGVSGLGAGLIADFGASIPIWFAFICLFLGTVMISFKIKS